MSINEMLNSKNLSNINLAINLLCNDESYKTFFEKYKPQDSEVDLIMRLLENSITYGEDSSDLIKPDSLIVQRKFLPIGQGAFYVEKVFSYSSEPKIYIYDCGTATAKDVCDINTQIDSIKIEGSAAIEALFISHFHADHISGISTLKDKLKINKVFIPYLSEEEKIICKIYNHSHLFENNIFDIDIVKEMDRLIDDPKEFFGDETILITVQKDDFNTDEIEFGDNNTNLSDITEDINLKSGTTLKCYDTAWYYVPFNYEEEEKKQFFIQKLEKEGIDKNIVMNNIDKIKKIYKVLSTKETIRKNGKEFKVSDLNSTTMALYSGHKNTEKVEGIIIKNREADIEKTHFHSGCLYLGDIDFTNKKIKGAIKKRLEKYWGNISILQIPHHGSEHNFDLKDIEETMQYAIISHGIKNRYKHPTIKDLNKNNKIICITEDKTSKFTQWFYYK